MLTHADQQKSDKLHLLFNLISFHALSLFSGGFPSAFCVLILFTYTFCCSLTSFSHRNIICIHVYMEQQEMTPYPEDRAGINLSSYAPSVGYLCPLVLTCSTDSHFLSPYFLSLCPYSSGHPLTSVLEMDRKSFHCGCSICWLQHLK